MTYIKISPEPVPGGHGSEAAGQVIIKYSEKPK
jgi:hypothetical protein